jgi:Mn-dependent DtxR family transcriptional regulator
MIYESGENYLKAIYFLQKERGEVRSVDVASYMDVSKPSVCRAVGQLQESGLLYMDDAKTLRLTEAGFAKARNIYEKYSLFVNMLLLLGVDAEIAVRDACRLEHISAETYESLKDWHTNIHCPRRFCQLEALR